LANVEDEISSLKEMLTALKSQKKFVDERPSI